MLMYNVMLGRGLGGIEQAFCDYHRALSARGHRVISVIHPDAQIQNDAAFPNPAEIKTLRAWSNWDLWAKYCAQKYVQKDQPDAIILHGGRAASLFKNVRALKIGVLHNYHFKRFTQLDGTIVITKHMREAAIHAGLDSSTMHVIPNMMRDVEKARYAPRAPQEPFVIGAIGRWVEKKGFKTLLEALALLKKKNISYRAIIAGDGEESAALYALRKKLELESCVEFPGWVKEKQEFFNQIDTLVIPSYHEPFGIVVLEGWRYSTPIIASASEGPSELITHNEDGILVPMRDPSALARAIEDLKEHPEKARDVSHYGFSKVQKEYAPSVIAEQLEKVILQSIRKAQ